MPGKAEPTGKNGTHASPSLSDGADPPIDGDRAQKNLEIRRADCIAAAFRLTVDHQLLIRSLGQGGRAYPVLCSRSGCDFELVEFALEPASQNDGADDLAIAPSARGRRERKHRHSLEEVRLALAVVPDEQVDARTGREV